MAIVSALIVEAAGDRFAIPQLSVVELVRARANSEHRIERIKDTAVLRLRNKLLPLMHLKKLLKIDDGSSSDPENGFIVVTQVGSQTFGIVVDGVFHTEEIVVKPMSTKLRHIDMFSGNTILGDGAVIMIIDPNGIAKALGASGARRPRDRRRDTRPSRASAAEQLTSLLVFRAGSNQPKAVPLGLVTRLEEIATDKIELSNGRYMVQYREQLMPLVQMEGVSVQTSGAQPILVFADDGRSMGLVVDEIIDIVEERLNIEVAGGEDGILGSAVIKGQATEVIDVGHFLPMAFADWFSRKEMRPSAAAQSVLLVDDSAFFRNMLAPVLKAAGYRVRVAPNAQEGLTALRSGQAFDVVLTDIEMPDMNGFEFAETIRADAHLSSAADHRAVLDGVAGGDRARPAGRLPRLRRQVRPSRPDRGAEGTDRRSQPRPGGGIRNTSMTSKTETSEGTVAEYVTAMIGGQLFGLPISRVQDVFMPERLTRVPLSPAEIAGVLNLRGRIVTVVDMRARLGPAQERRRQAADGGRRRPARRILWPPDRPDRRGAAACPTTAARKTPSTSIPAWPSSPAACIASTASSWSSSTSIASSKSCLTCWRHKTGGRRAQTRIGNGNVPLGISKK